MHPRPILRVHGLRRHCHFGFLPQLPDRFKREWFFERAVEQRDSAILKLLDYLEAHPLILFAHTE